MRRWSKLTRFIRGLVMSTFVMTAAAQAEVMPEISQERALQIATADAGGFLGTWVDATRSGNFWHVSARSKSANPPVLYILDVHSGKILFKAKNSDDTSVVGSAIDTEQGAFLTTPENLRIAIDNLAAWPAKLVNRRVVVKGGLKSRPAAARGDAPGEPLQLIMERATYNEARRR